jgi:sec-independent protein translocase protein TatA
MPFLGNIGPGELIIILVIALVIFGPGKLPEIGQAVGKGIREFRRAASDITDATRVDTAAPPAPPVAGSAPTPMAAPPATQPGAAAPPPAGDTTQDDPGRPSA